MMTRRLRWNLPSTQDVLTSGTFRSASAQARTRKSVIVTFSAPGTESFSCCRIATARSTRASTVTVNSGTADFASAMRRAMVACIRVGSTTSTSGPGLPAMRGGTRAAGGGEVRLPAAACTSSFTMQPSASASRSKVGLPDSPAAITSPFLTASTLFFFHSTTVPSSIVSESFGMLTSGIGLLPADHLARVLLDVLARRDGRLLQGQAVRHRHLSAAQPADRRVQVVEAPLLDPGGDLRGDAIRRPALLDHEAPARAANPPHDGPPRHRPRPTPGAHPPPAILALQ